MNNHLPFSRLLNLFFCSFKYGAVFPRTPNFPAIFSVKIKQLLPGILVFLLLGGFNVYSAQTYCTPARTSVDAITRVQLAGAVPSSGLNHIIDNENNSYYNNTSNLNVPVLYPGATYSVSVSARGNLKHFAVMWIDFNNNGTFEAAEMVGKYVGNVAGPGPNTVTFNITVPAAATSGNHRLRLLWQYNTTTTDDNYYDNRPCAADAWGQTRDYTITVPACAAPTARPTALSFSNLSATQISGSFSGATGAPSGYLVLRSTSATLTQNPLNGTLYTAGQTIGNSVVIQSSAALTFTDTGRTANTRYYYFVIPFNNTNCAGGVQYFSTLPLTSSAVTCPVPPVGSSVSTVTTSGATIAWPGSAGGSAAAVNYTLEVSPSSTFATQVAGSPFSNGSSLSRAISLLSPDTVYYYRITASNGCNSTYATGSFRTLCAALSPASTLAVTATNTTVNGTFTASPSAPAGYVIVRTTDPQAPVLTNGTVYTSGTVAGDLFFVRGSNTANVSTSFSAPGGAGVYSFHVYAYSLCDGAPFYSAPVSARIVSCRPTSASGSVYIKSVKFIGSLTPDIENQSGYTSGGYHDYTALLPKTKQIPGGVINLNVQLQGPLSPVKAWVDWNRDGFYSNDESETIYFTGSGVDGVQVINVIFGFVVKNEADPGLYNLRIRAGAGNDDPCSHQTSGETEDYSFEVIPSCDAKIEAVGASRQCGSGTVTLNATGNAGTVSYQWYASEFGAPIGGVTGPVLETTVLAPGNYTYYVSASNGSCWSTSRTPISFRIDPVPIITFTQSSPDICGVTTSVLISTSADKEEATLLEENFEGPEAASAFQNMREGNTDVNGFWRVEATPYVPGSPPYFVLKPALSSGATGNKFGVIVSDLRQKTDILNHFVLKDNLNFTGFTDLKLDFKLYYFPEEEQESKNYLKIDYTLNNGATWINLKTYISPVGGPGRFAAESIVLPEAVAGAPAVKIRYSLFALGKDNEWITDIAALDDMRIYGNRSLPANFQWIGDNSIIFNETCSGPVPTEGAATVCLKPGTGDLETNTVFAVTAKATLANGCTVFKELAIPNNNKIWNPATTADTWDTAEWLPNTTIPDADKCVIVKKPLRLANTDGFARNLIVEPGGKLVLQAPHTLSLKNYIINRAPSSDMVVSSDANLLQIDDSAVNIGAITVKRDAWMKRLDYTYWSSPVKEQLLKKFSPQTVASRFMTYNEANDYFEPISPDYNDFAMAKGYAIRSPNNFPADNLTYKDFYGVFTGVPNNSSGRGEVGSGWDIVFPLTKYKNGYNLIGNPYPSNIDFTSLVALNNGKIHNLAYFWTNVNHTPEMQGSNYPNGDYVNNYAALTGTAGVPATYTKTSVNPENGEILQSKTPNEIIKVGQGFIVKSTVHQENLLFKNSIRTGDPKSVFFNSKHRGAESKDRFWIQLTTPLGVVTTAAVGYVRGATDDVELDFDAPLLGLGSDALFTSVGDQRLAVQGKVYPLNPADIVSLGMSHHTAGTYTLAVPRKEGVFGNIQAIYLKDNETGLWTNLTEEPYSFHAERGLSEGRFELRYQRGAVLGTATAAAEDFLVYRRGDDFVVKSFREKVAALELYDTAGRLISHFAANQLEVVLPAAGLPEGVYVLKILRAGKINSRKILK